MPLTALIEMNERWLFQGIALVARLDDASYSQAPAGLAPHRAGAHLRHILDFYDSFLNGLDTGRIDYDARSRCERTATVRAVAIERMHRIIGRLRLLRLDRELLVRIEDADPAAEGWVSSSLTRELQMLSSHTIHHFALIAMTLRAHGVSLDPAFGMAPSTLRHAASVQAA
jgi:uncharacterized damage-inducible protein DinB